MIITVKNLQQQTFTVNFQAEKTVLELKETIFNERGPEYVVEKQKLIYAGVILSDERTIASYNVDEKKFVVVMLKRDLGGLASKPDESGSQSALSSSSNTTSGGGGSSSSEASVSSVKTAQSVVKDVRSSGSSDEATKSVGSDNDGRGAPLATVDSNTSLMSIGSAISGTSGPSDTSQSTFSSGDLAGVFSNTSLQVRAESSLLMGEEYNRSVESMVEMGYGREMVERAMAASFNNPERAVEYLISGIPETDDQFNAATAAAGESALLRGAADVGAAVAAAAEASTGGVRSGASAGTPAASALGAGVIASGGDRGTAVRGGVGGDRAAVSRTVGGAADAAAEMRTIEGGNARGSVGNAPEDPFEFLRNQPQFLQMRSLVYQNPDLLQAVLQQIGQTNPALLQLISENQDAFLSMLNQPMDGQGDNAPQYMQRMTLGRRAQLAAAARAAAGGDGLHVRPSPDIAPGAGGDGLPIARQRPGESGDADSDSIAPNMQPSRIDPRTGERRALSDAFVRERAAAAAAVAALTAAASGVVDRDVGGGEGGGGGRGTGSSSLQHSSNPAVTASAFGGDAGGVATLRLTPQDQDAIERLKALGFPETLVLQAYFACDKDEQLAANFLISSAFDD